MIRKKIQSLVWLQFIWKEVCSLRGNILHTQKFVLIFKKVTDMPMCCFMVAKSSSSHVLQDKIKLVFTFLNKMYHYYGKDRYNRNGSQ